MFKKNSYKIVFIWSFMFNYPMCYIETYNKKQ